MALTSAERPGSAGADGLLVLNHGRGSDEQDLIGLADVFDPGRRLHVVAPRAPLELAGSPGHHWYVSQRVSHPHADSFHAAYRELAAFHDALWERTGIGPERTVLGGFSMGTVMTYALGLGGDRPGPAGILAMSGFVPTVPGWEPSLEDRPATKILIAHGRNDLVIPVTFARAARDLLEPAAFALDYRESEAAHHVDPGDVPRVVAWLEDVLAPAITNAAISGVSMRLRAMRGSPFRLRSRHHRRAPRLGILRPAPTAEFSACDFHVNES
jgi:phospholipase/carboxylesterase